MIRIIKKLKTKKSKAKDKSCIKMLFQCNDILDICFLLLSDFILLDFAM